MSLGALPLAALTISIHKRGRFNLQAMMHRAASKFQNKVLIDWVMGVTRLRIWGSGVRISSGAPPSTHLRTLGMALLARQHGFFE
jgi:hypothetical protein